MHGGARSGTRANPPPTPRHSTPSRPRPALASLKTCHTPVLCRAAMPVPTDSSGAFCVLQCGQVFHKLTNPVLYGIEPESAEHLYALEEVAKEVMALLSPACEHPNIVTLVGVVVDGKGRPVKLLFEWADCGDMDG